MLNAVDEHPAARQPRQRRVSLSGDDHRWAINAEEPHDLSEQITWPRCRVGHHDLAAPASLGGPAQLGDQPGQGRVDRVRDQSARHLSHRTEPVADCHQPLERVTAAPGCLNEVVDPADQPSRVGRNGADLGEKNIIAAIKVEGQRANCREGIAHAVGKRVVLPRQVAQADQRGDSRDGILTRVAGRETGEDEQGQLLLSAVTLDATGCQQPLGHRVRIELRMRLVPADLGGKGVRVTAPPRGNQGTLLVGELGDVGHRHQQHGPSRDSRWHAASACRTRPMGQR